MKVLIFSDSHGKVQYMQRAIDIHYDCDYIVHLGDGASDADYLVIPKNAVYIGVKGNCDVYAAAPAELTESFGKVKTLLCHGHNYFVKSSLSAYEAHARALGVSVALYGHTHERYLEYRNGIYFFNPGSIGRPPTRCHSYGLMSISNGQVLLSHGEV